MKKWCLVPEWMKRERKNEQGEFTARRTIIIQLSCLVHFCQEMHVIRCKLSFDKRHMSSVLRSSLSGCHATLLWGERCVTAARETTKCPAKYQRKLLLLVGLALVSVLLRFSATVFTLRRRVTRTLYALMMYCPYFSVEVMVKLLGIFRSDYDYEYDCACPIAWGCHVNSFCRQNLVAVLMRTTRFSTNLVPRLRVHYRCKGELKV